MKIYFGYVVEYMFMDFQ